MSSKSIDRRSFIRIPFKTDVLIKAGDLLIRSNGETDISMSGLRIPYQGAVPDSAPCRATITLKALQDEVVIEAAGRIIRSAPDSVAVEFTELDLDSYNHLRQLILMNAKDPEKAEEEFDSHWGIKRPSR